MTATTEPVRSRERFPAEEWCARLARAGGRVGGGCLVSAPARTRWPPAILLLAVELLAQGLHSGAHRDRTR